MLKLKELIEFKLTREKSIEYIIYFLFIMPLFGTSIPAYIFVILYSLIFFRVIKFKLIDILLLSAIMLFFYFKALQSDFYSCIVLFRYYFGFFIFYLFFNNLSTEIKFDKILWLICVCVVIEAVLINTIIRPEWLPNYPKGEFGELNFETRILGFYQRPYSIGTSSTITSTVIMTLIFFIFGFNKEYYKNNISNFKKLYYLSVFSVIILGSGTGYGLLILFWIYRIGPFKNMLNSIVAIVFILTLYALIFVYDIGKNEGLEKISSEYLEFLYYFKGFQIEKFYIDLSLDDLQLIIGKKFYDSKELIIWSDFAWNDLFYCTGYVGFWLTISILILKMRKFNYIPILIFMIGAIHYGACYSLPGQLLLGCFISTRFNKKIIMNERLSNQK